MKILQINSVCGIKSTGRICTDIADMITAEGHECKIAYGREMVPEKYKKYAVKIGNNLDVYFHVFKSRLFDKSGFGSKRATKKFIRWIEEYDPDIIHLHNIHGYYINIKLLFDYLKNGNAPVVWTLHDCWAFTGHSAYCGAISCEKWKTGCVDCPQKSIYPKSFIDRSKKNFEEKSIIFNKVKNLTVITPSHFLYHQVKESFLSSYQVKVIPNGIDLSIFKPTVSNFREEHKLHGKFILLALSSVWNEYKGFYDLKKISHMLNENVIIVIVGVSISQMKELNTNMIGFKSTNNTQELAEIYSAADYFINLSYTESFGLVTVESMACGTPVIVYNRSSIPEVVAEGTGQIFETADLEGIADFINEKSKTEFVKSESACIMNASKFDKVNSYKKYYNNYMEILN